MKLVLCEDSCKKLANMLDDYYLHNQDNSNLRDMLEFKKSATFRAFFENITNTTEKDIALLLLYQLIRDSQDIRQEIIKNNPELPVSTIKSLEEACIYVEDLLKSGATQEAKTTICILGNTGAGKSSLVRTLRDYCKSKNQEPKPFLTGDPQNKQFLETKVMELIQDIKLEPSMKCVVELQKNLKDSRFGLISLCPEDSIREEGKEDISDHLQIAFVDFAGHSEYVSCSTLFMKETGVFLICFLLTRALMS